MNDLRFFDTQIPTTFGRDTTRVLIVAAAELFRDVLLDVLANDSGISVVGHSRPGDDAIAAADRHMPDVVVIDSEIGPDAEGVRSGYKIKAAHPSIGIVVLSTALGGDLVNYLPRRTGSGWSFLSRAAALDLRSLAAAIDASASGRGSVDPALGRLNVQKGPAAMERLTAQQSQALELIAAGISDSGIADKLDLTISTALRLVDSIYDDLHIMASPLVERRVVAAMEFLKASFARSR